MAQAAVAMRASSSTSAAVAVGSSTGKVCVVCCETIFRWEPLKYCRELLWNKNVGEFLVRFEVVSAGGVSLDSTICHQCWHYVTTADKASSIVDENVYMLRARVKRGDGGGGERQLEREPGGGAEADAFPRRAAGLQRPDPVVPDGPLVNGPRANRSDQGFAAAAGGQKQPVARPEPKGPRPGPRISKQKLSLVEPPPPPSELLLPRSTRLSSASKAPTPFARPAPGAESKKHEPAGQPPPAPAARRGRPPGPRSLAKSNPAPAIAAADPTSRVASCKVVLPGIEARACGTCGQAFAYGTAEQRAAFRNHETTHHLRTFRRSAPGSSVATDSEEEEPGPSERPKRGPSLSKPKGHQPGAKTSAAADSSAAKTERASRRGDEAEPRPAPPTRRSAPAEVKKDAAAAAVVVKDAKRAEEFACERCPKTFHNAKALAMHARKLHGRPAKVVGPPKCRTCKRVFFTDKGLKVHEQRGCPDAPKAKRQAAVANGASAASKNVVKCKQCAKILPRDALKAHLLAVHPKVPIAQKEPKTDKTLPAKRKMLEEKKNKRKKLVATKKSKRKGPAASPASASAEDPVGDDDDVITGDAPADDGDGDGYGGGVDPLFEPETASSTISYECLGCGEAFADTYALAEHVRRCASSADPTRGSEEAENGVDLVVLDGPDGPGAATANGTGAGVGGARVFRCTHCDKTFKTKPARETHAAKAHRGACVCCRDLYLSRDDETQYDGFCVVCNKDVRHRNAHVVWIHSDVMSCNRCFMEFATIEAFEFHVAENCAAAEGDYGDGGGDYGDGSGALEPMDEGSFEYAEFGAGAVGRQEPEDPFAGEQQQEQYQPSSSSPFGVTGVFACRFCPAELSSEPERLRHMTNSHWSCIKCPEIFGDRLEFTEHLKTHVGVSNA